MDRHEGTFRLQFRSPALQPRSAAFFVPAEGYIPKKVEATERNGTKKRDYEFLPIEFLVSKNGEQAMVVRYYAKTDQLSRLQACYSLISNMVDGVRRNFIYKMHLVCVYFIIILIVNDSKTVEMRSCPDEMKGCIANMLEDATSGPGSCCGLSDSEARQRS